MNSALRPSYIIAAALVLTVLAGALSWFYLGGGETSSVKLPPPAPKVAPSFKAELKPALQPVAARPATEEPAMPQNEFLSKLTKNGQKTKLTADELKAYLLENKGSAESLLIASRISGDLNLLRQAAKQFPNDPRVQFDMATRGESAAERRSAIDALRQAAPDNAMGDYLSALDNFKSKNPAAALDDIKQAAAKGRMEDYGVENLQGAEEAYQAAGYSPLDAKAAAMSGLLLPQLTQLNQLGAQLSDMQQGYIKDGDAASAESVSRSALAVAQQMQSQLGHQFLLSDLVGVSMEAKVLAGIDPNSVLDASGLTVQQRMDQLNQMRADIKDLASTNLNMLQNLPPREVVSYFDRAKLYGEPAAIQWLRQKYGQ